MSCKIFAGGAVIQELYFDEVDAMPASPVPVRAPSEQPTIVQVEDVESKARIAELERKLAEFAMQAEHRVREARETAYAAGRKDAADEVEPVLQRLAKTIQTLSAMRATLRKQAEEDLVKLSLGIAKRILHRELTVDPEALAGVAATALERLNVREICRVRVHPSYEPALRRHLEQAGAARVEFQSDLSLEPGDLQFETARGTLDASTDSQLREIERGLIDLLNK